MFRRSINFFPKKIKPSFALSKDVLGSTLKESKKLDMVLPDGDLTASVGHVTRDKLKKIQDNFRWDEETKRYVSGKSLAVLSREVRLRK